MKKFFRLSYPEKKMLMEAIFFLYLAKLVLLLFPFKRCLIFFRKQKDTTQPLDQNTLEQIKIAVARTNRVTFWKNRCLVQSMAARWMLQRRKIPSRLSLGLSFDENNKLIAHAWIRVKSFEIVNKNLNFKELYVIE